MSSQTISFYSRLDGSETRSASAPAKATRAQSALEIALFVVFGLTIVIAAVSLMASSSASHRAVPNRVAEGIKADRVNVLIATTSRDGDDGPITTDAMLLLSVKPSTHGVAVTAIPRDLWVPIGTYGTRRLSSAIAVGSSSGYPGEGPGLTSDTVEKVTGQPVHAYLTLDERDLASAIDAVGGIDVPVNRGVYDFRSRDRFTPGVHHMNGQRALRFAQSPYVIGPSSTRLAHEVRQQEVILSFLARATQPGRTLPFPMHQRASGTNLTPEQTAMLASWVGGREPRRVSLAHCVDVFEVNSFVYSGEALRPRGGNYDEIRRVVANVFTQAAVATP